MEHFSSLFLNKFPVVDPPLSQNKDLATFTLILIWWKFIFFNLFFPLIYPRYSHPPKKYTGINNHRLCTPLCITHIRMPKPGFFGFKLFYDLCWVIKCEINDMSNWIMARLFNLIQPQCTFMGWDWRFVGLFFTVIGGKSAFIM